MPPPVFRFAPSPNGYLHLGHAFSALLNFDLARQAGGRFLLRLEDIDTVRCKPEFETAIYQDLAWLGIAWEEPVRRQSNHFADYRAAIETLSGRGWFIPALKAAPKLQGWWRSASPRDPWPRDPDGAPLYPGTAKRLAPDARTRLLESGVAYALRLDMAAACAQAGELGWIERGEGPAGETGAVTARPARLGRRRSGAQGNADQLSPLGGGRRRAAGRDGCSARPGPVLVDERASAAARPARFAGADLPAPPAGARCGRTKTVEVERCHRPARAPCRRRDAGRHSPFGRIAPMTANRVKVPRRVTSEDGPWHAQAGPGSGETWRQDRAHRAICR